MSLKGHSSIKWVQAEFGAEVAGESERNEMIATKPRRSLLDQMRTQQRSHAYASRRGRHAQMASLLRTHLVQQCPSRFCCDPFVPFALSGHFRSELRLLNPETLKRTHQGIVQNGK
ncbi:hypothetical protein PIB30_049413 [Stylosanthes scabra]|uniref:Uncharacterized protein n=1 Tax=Stylosanthes scabra TaxID=79078 RepID=A0ABU6ZG25_9FABA|nr:hypothetical protein [Stylosanthes scabra]